MTKFLGIFFLLFSTAAYAQTTESHYDENLINTLHYRDAAHTFYTSLNLQTALVRTEGVWSGTGQIDHYSTNSLQSTLDLTYGLTDVWEIGVSESYIWNYERDQSIGGSTTAKLTGESDPTFQLSYRFLGGLVGEKFATVYVNVLPAIGNKENATATQNGNDLSASSYVSLGSNIYWVAGMHEFGVNPFLDYYTSGTSHNTTTTTTNDSYWTYGVGGNYRYHMSDKFAFSLNVQVTAPYSLTYHQPGYTQSNSYPLQMSETVSFNWKPAETWLVSAALSNSGMNVLETFDNGNNLNDETYQTNYFTLTAAHIY